MSKYSLFSINLIDFIIEFFKLFKNESSLSLCIYGGSLIILSKLNIFDNISFIILNKRTPVYNSLIYKDNTWFMDFDDLQKKIDKNTKMLILCNPANPVGRVWTIEELKTLADICLKNNIIVVSDEIHCDLVMPGFKYTPFATISEQISDLCITCTSASKTFNIAGLYCSNIFIKNKLLYNKFMNVLLKNGLLSGINLFGIVATYYAYTYGEDWLNQVLNYIYENYLFLKEFINKNIPKIEVTKLEGTFLVFLNFNRFKLKDEELLNIFENKCKLWIDEGIKFGKEGSGFIRLNIATSRKNIKIGLNKIYENFKNL